VRSATPSDDLHDRTIDDVYGIGCEMEGHPQPPPARGDDSTVSCFPSTAVIKFQCRQHRFRRLKQCALNAEITERAEIWTHGVARIQKGLELSLQLQQHSTVVRVGTHLVTGDEQAQVERELLDSIKNTIEPFLADRVLRRPI
jgi:hypothetical protein